MLHKTTRMVFRPQNRAGFPAVTQVRSVGEYRVPPHWNEAGKRKDFFELFWVMEGVLHFRADCKNCHIGDGGVFFYYPGEEHIIRCGPEGAHYFWLTLDAPGMRGVLAGLDLTIREFRAGEVPETLFRDIMAALEQAMPRGEMEAARLAYDILTQLAWQRRLLQPESDLGERLRTGIDARYADPRFNIEALAADTGLHRATVFRTFRQIHGISPSVYLQRRRLVHGLSLLEQTSKPVYEIALAAGYMDPNHFAKAVRKATCQSPSDFRRHGRS